MKRPTVPLTERFPRSFAGLGRQMENLMERYFGPEEEWWGVEAFTPTTNLAETDSEYEVTLDLPGMRPEDVNVELQNGNLVVSGERKEEKEETKRTFHRVERSYGSFRRTIPLPGTVDEGKVDASFRDGVLKIRLPKTEEAKPRQIKINE
ncbi:MAG: Hsp20/alpha crystallin family protein [Pirellulales bacterium]